MKQSKRLSIFTTFLLSVGVLTFIPTVSPAQAAATCSGNTCTQTFAYTGAAQTFSPNSAGVTLTFTVNGGGGGHGGGDAGGGGGTGSGGSRVSFDYVTTSTSPLYLYVGAAGGNGGGGSCANAGVLGSNPWTIYNGGRGGYPGCTGSSGAGGAGGAASVVSTGDKTGVIGIAGGGAGGGGANINSNGTNGGDDTGTQTSTTTGANGQDFGGDGSGGGGGGGGFTGGTGGAAVGDGGSPAGRGGVAGKSSFPLASRGSSTSNINTGNGSITITWPNGPSASTRPSFTDSTIAKVGQVLTPTDGVFVASAGTVTVSNKRWQISADGITWTDISPITSGDYTIAAGDVGKYVRFAENATDSNSTLTWGSLPSLQITGVPVFTAESPADAAASTTVNTAYAGYTFVATGYRDVYTISSGALPAGITLNSSTGVLSGTSTATGTYKYKVKVTNEAGTDETVELTLIVGKAPVFTSDDSTLQSVNRVTNPIRVGTTITDFVFTTAAYLAATYELKTDVATIPACVTYASTCASSFETMALPEGLTFNPTTATLSGTPTKTGAYVFAIKATNSLGSAVDVIHMSIAAKAPVAFNLSSDKSSVIIVQGTTVTATVTATGGSGNGAYSFAVDPSATGICSVAPATANTATMTVIAAGNCVIVGTKAADAGFAASKATITIPVNKAAQSAALVITPDATPLTYAGASTWLRGTGGSGTGAFTWAIDASSSSVCGIFSLSGNNMYPTLSTSGTCVVNVTKTGDAYFLPQTTTYTFGIGKATQTALYVVNNGASNWNAITPPTYNLSTGGGSGTGAVTYTLDPASAATCSMNGTVLTAKSAGTCTVTAYKAGDINYNPATSPALTWWINAINQPALTTTGATPAGVAIAYNSNVQYAANPTYLAVLTTTGGAGTGAYGYVASNASGCVVIGAGATAYVSAAPTGAGVGWCTITITKAADTNYNVQSTTFQFYIPAGNQTALVVTPANPSMDFVPTTISDPTTAAKDQLTVTGGLGTGLVTYAVLNTSTTVCSVDANGLITDKTAGTCVITVTKAADTNYLVQTAQVTVVFNKLSQAELVSVPANASQPFVWSPKATNQITTSGGAGTGAVTYAVDPSSSTVCSVNASNGLITDITAGTCIVIATKAADTNYSVITDTVTVVFTKINAAAITLSAAPATIAYTNAANKVQTWVTVAGGASSSGAFTFYIDPMTEEYCSIATIRATQILVNGNLAGVCLITVVQAADVNYNEQRAFIGVNITKMVQTIGATSSNGTSLWFKVIPDVVTTITVTNPAGTGANHFVVDPTSTSSCVVDQTNGNVTSTTVGTCKVTVTRDGDDNVAASNAIVLNLTIVRINQAVITSTPNADFKLAASGPANTSVLVIGVAYTGTGNFTKIVSATPLVCTITGGGDSAAVPATFTATSDLTNKITVTALDDGTCTLQYSKLGDANFNAVVNGTASFTIGKATQADITASITAGSATMPFVATPKATATVTGAAGSGTGVFNYTVDPTSSTVCSVNLTTGVVTDITAGTCLIIVKRLTDTTYLESSPKTVTITFTKIDQAALTLTAAKLALKATTSALDTTTVTAAGGTGTGAVTYTIAADSLTVCSISGSTVTGLAPGDCTVVATKAADVNYNVASATVKLNVTKGNQAALVVTPYWASVVYSPATALDTSLINAFVWGGGTGSGDLVFSIDPASAQVCNRAAMRPGVPSHIQVFAVGSGTCTISVYKSGGTAWENSNTVVSSFPIVKAAQATLTATASVSTIQYFNAPAATFTVTTTGGSGTGALNINIAPASAAICADATVAGGPLTVKTIGIGNCLLTVTKATDSGYTVITSGQITISITKGTQAALVATATPGALTYASNPKVTSTLAVTGGAGDGTLTTVVDSGSTAICSYNDVTKQITALAPGVCDLTITKAAGADGLFLVQSTKLRVVIAKTAQTKLTLTAIYPQLMYVESPLSTTPLAISGGSGTGAVTYSVDPGAASVCSVAVINNVPVVTANYYGFCVVTATKAADATYDSATATATIRIALPGTQIAATVPSTTVTFVASPGTVSTVTVAGSLDNDVISYSVDASSKNICSVTGNGITATVTSLSTGQCSILVIDVSKASDGTLIASSAVATLTIVKADQTGVTATPATTSVYFSTPAATDVITVAGGVTGSTVTASVDPSTAANCSVAVVGNKITMTALAVGDCLINYTKTGNANFNDFSGIVDITVLKSKQANLVASSNPASLVYSATTPATALLTVTGGSGTGAVTYVVADASSTICSISGRTITAITGGDCVVVITKAGDNNYADATVSVTVNIAKANQAALTETAVSQNLTYDASSPATTTLSTTGGSGTGDVTYSISPASSTICSIDGNVVTALMPGNCVVVATKAADPFFNAVTATTTIVIAKANQTALVATGTPSALIFTGGTVVQSVISANGGSGLGALTYTVSNASKAFCFINVDTITAIGVGDCVITATKAADAYFNVATATVTVSIAKGPQAPLTPTSNPTSLSYSFTTPATAIITAVGGSGTGAVTYAIADVSKTICSISGNKITALTSGDCVVIATKAADANYQEATGSITVSIAKAIQANLIGSSGPASLVYSATTAPTATITVSGGSGTGAITYALTDASKSICSIAGNKITAITGGDCVVIATKAGDSSYADSSATVTVNIAKANQVALTETAATQALTYNPDATVTTTVSTAGGSGTGTVSYAVSPASASFCSIAGNVVTVLLPGNCVITATKAADSFYNAATATTTIVIAKAAQSTLIAKIAAGSPAQPQWNGVTTTQVVITGGDGYGAMSLVNNSTSICSLVLVGQRVNLTALAAGTCSFTVTKASDYAFLVSTPFTSTVTVGSAATDLSVTVESVGKAVAGGQGAIDLTVTNNGPSKASGATLVYTLPTGITSLVGMSAGCTLTSSTQVTCVSSSVLTAGASVKFTIPISLAGSLVGGNLTTGGQATLTSATPDSNRANNNVTGEPANFVVNKAPTAFNKTTIAGLQTGKSFSDQVTAVGFPAVTYTISAGDLPAGLTLNPDTGAITGIPTGVGAYSFTVSAYNSAGSTSQVYSGSIAPAPFVTAPAAGFGTNTVPAGTKVTIGGLNLDLITAAIIGGTTVKISSKSSTAITLEVPNATAAGAVPISLIYAQGTIDGGTFTYTGQAKVTPTVVLNAGNTAAGAGETARTLTASITAVGVTGPVTIPVTYTSKTTAVCTVAGDQLTFLTAGTCTLGAATAANGAFNAATSATVSLNVTKSAQTLAIVLPKDTVPPTVATDSADGFDLAVTASSGLTPSFVSATPDICDVTDDGHVSGIKPGHCVVTITQAGDNRFAPIASTQMEFDITADSGQPTVDNGDPLHPTSLANGALNKMGDVGFTWNKKLAALSVETYGIWIGKINAVSEFTIAGKAYKCSVDFGILKAMASKTPAQLKLAMAKKTFKAAAPFCNAKTEAAAYKALKAGYVGLSVKVTITRYRMYPTTYLPINAKTKKPITTQLRVVYLTLG